MDYCEWSESGADYSLWGLSKLEDGILRLKKQRSGCILVEYPFGRAHPAIAPYLDCAIWIDVPLDIALARRALRDYLRRDPARRAMKNPMAQLEQYFDDYLSRMRKADITHEATVSPGCDFMLDGTLPPDKMAEYAINYISLL